MGISLAETEREIYYGLNGDFLVDIFFRFALVCSTRSSDNILTACGWFFLRFWLKRVLPNGTCPGIDVLLLLRMVFYDNEFSFFSSRRVSI